ncbi:hypothetical protein AB0G74_13395 [Streptomyces sp. NPDC020875]|uniref:hypothetical protein n=1 Tax=Streptomyces sp. NPDC020875 TaxID=3154898 RepID=UPI0033C4A755
MTPSANLAMMHAADLAKELDKNKVTPGVLGFLVFAGLAVGVWFLMKSMTRHMNRIDFDQTSAGAGAGAGAGAAEAAAGAPSEAKAKTSATAESGTGGAVSGGSAAKKA